MSRPDAGGVARVSWQRGPVAPDVANGQFGLWLPGMHRAFGQPPGGWFWRLGKSRNGGRQGWAEVRTGKGGRGREFTENGADPKVRPVGSDGAPSASSSFPTGSAHKTEAAPSGRPFQTGRNRSRNLPEAGSWLMRSGFASGYIMFLEETGSCPIRHRRGGRTWRQAV